MKDSKVNIVSCVTINVAVTALLRALFIEMFLKGFFPPKRKIASYRSQPVPVPAHTGRLEEHNDEDSNNAQDVEVI